VSHPVLAISGPPGSGKSTLIAALVARHKVHVVHFDAHEQMTDRSLAQMEDWIARGMPLAEMLPPSLIKHLRAAAEDAPVLFETPLGRAIPDLTALIRWSVWLDLPADIALSRKIAATVQEADWASQDELSQWLHGYLAAYPRIVAPCLTMQAQRVRPLADQVLDARLSPTELADALSVHLRGWSSGR
jgi:uridine kinase